MFFFPRFRHDVPHLRPGSCPLGEGCRRPDAAEAGAGASRRDGAGLPGTDDGAAESERTLGTEGQGQVAMVFFVV